MLLSVFQMSFKNFVLKNKMDPQPGEKKGKKQCRIFFCRNVNALGSGGYSSDTILSRRSKFLSNPFSKLLSVGHLHLRSRVV